MTAPAELHVRQNVEPGVMAHSGVLVPVDPFSTVVPTIEDIGLALSRTPRFGGHTRRWWSVLDHTLFVANLAGKYASDEGWSSATRRSFITVALLHDAHESLTSDVPTWFKTPDFKAQQKVLDTRFFAALMKDGVWYAELFHDLIRNLDWRALLAEAYIVGPPALVTMSDVEHYFGERPDTDALTMLDNALRKEQLGVDPVQLRKGVNACNVTHFVNLYRSLR